ncbi:Type 1 phosphatases regulator ypi1, partial [Coemansia sp. RSA 2681]
MTQRTETGSGASLASHGSRTAVVAGAQESRRASPATGASADGVLRLRAPPQQAQQAQPRQSQQPQPQQQQQQQVPNSPRVQWASGTVDNEHMGRKKSKVCCIFRRQRQFGESDSDESCSGGGSGGDDDDDSPNEYERMPRPAGRKH